MIGRGPSWKLSASTENTIDPSRTTPKMTAFANSVTMKKGPKENVELTGESVFEWDKSAGSMLVVAFQQKTSLRFRLVRNMDYMIEFARYDTYDVPKPALQSLTNQLMKKSQISQPPIVRDQDPSQRTDWGATLWKSSWDDQFVPNTTLGIGQQAYWDPKIEAWFPDPVGAPASAREGEVSKGVKEFLEIVGEVNGFLSEIKKGVK